MNQQDVENQIIEVIRKSHAEQIKKSEPIITSYTGLYNSLSHLKPDEINNALMKMNSVKIIDGMVGNLEFLPNLF